MAKERLERTDGIVKRKLTILFAACLLLGLSVPVFAASEGTQIIELHDRTAVLSYSRHDEILLPVGTVTKTTNIESNVLINNKYDGPWQETCIDGAIVYCESGAEIKIAEPYSYGDDGSMNEFRLYFGSIKPAEVNRHHDVQLPDSIDTSRYSDAQIDRITGDICLVEYRDYEIDEAGNIESLSTPFEGTYQLPDGTYYVEMVGTEIQKSEGVSASPPSSFPSSQFVVVVGEAPSSADAATFSDVPTNAYYYDAVYWAVKEAIVNGTSPTTFTPDRTCIATEIITLLWRAAGEPASSAQLPFAMNKGLEYAEGALRWAYGKGMIDARFNQTAPCTRASAVKYIWQAENSPAVSATAGFTDVPAGADYAQAVTWAVSRGIVNGTTPTTFTPDRTCTRAEIVTLLYRNRAN